MASWNQSLVLAHAKSNTNRQLSAQLSSMGAVTQATCSLRLGSLLAENRGASTWKRHHLAYSPLAKTRHMTTPKFVGEGVSKLKDMA